MVADVRIHPAEFKPEIPGDPPNFQFGRGAGFPLDRVWRPNQSAAVQTLSLAELEAKLDRIRQSPRDVGTVKLVVRRPEQDTREILATGQLDPALGLVGDNWKTRGSRSTPDGSANPEMQLNVMNARVVELLAETPERRALAGDQLYVDFDLSESNCPTGTRLAIGAAVIEVTAPPHTGCRKFSARFGADAMKFVNSEEGRKLRLRGLNAKVIIAGAVRPGDPVRKL